MILCHTGMYSGGFWGKLISQIIYSFHMPAFFIISGYLYKSHAWWKTAKAFLLPVLFFSVIVLIRPAIGQYFRFGSIHINELVDLNTCWCNCTGHAPLFTGQWFIFALMGCRFLMGDVGVFKFLGKHYRITGIICFAYVTIDGYLNEEYFFKTTYLYNSVVAMAFVTFGMFLQEHKFDFFKYSISLCTALSIVAISLSVINGRIDMLWKNYGLSPILFYLNAVIASLSLFMWTSKLKQYDCVMLYSVGTLALLGSHMILYSYIAPYFKSAGLCIELVSVISTIFIVLLNYPLISFCSQKANWILGK